ncbi:MAG: gamma-glutamyltransferase, partial [Acidobacteriaceae bacterium]
MLRRTFLATLPLAAAGSSAVMKGEAPGVGEVQQAAAESELPKFQAAGEEKFDRPDVHAGDRPAGASFASRSAALG